MKKFIILIASILYSKELINIIGTTTTSDTNDKLIDTPLGLDILKLTSLSNYNYDKKLQETILSIESNDFNNISDKSNALYDLGEQYMYKTINNLLPNETIAMYIFNESAKLGNPGAQFYLGVAYSTGFWGIKRNVASGILYYYFAAMNDNIGGLMALGHKYQYGINVPKSCEASLLYYERAANYSMAHRRDLDVLPGLMYDNRPIRLKSIIEGGNKPNTLDEEIFEYYLFQANKGDIDALLSLGLLHYYGTRGTTQDFIKAFNYFKKAMEFGSTTAIGALGHMYLHGYGTEIDEALALKLFQEASNEGIAGAQNGLGYMYLHGKSVEKDINKAKQLFEAAGNQGHAEALYNLGLLSMGLDSDYKPDFKEALNYFFMAARNSHTDAIHKLGKMQMYGIGTHRSCTTALHYFKLAAERGPWVDQMKDAYNKLITHKNERIAFNIYVSMAEMGYEIAQHNTAFMVDNMNIDHAFNKSNEGEIIVRYYKLAANQGNNIANLKIGDCYYYGKGNLKVDYKRAMAHYNQASRRQNAQAMYSLGYMHEYGVGTPQDLNLAKRWYDMSLQASINAYLPITIALYKLKFHSFIRGLHQTIEANGYYSALLFLFTSFRNFYYTRLMGYMNMLYDIIKRWKLNTVQSENGYDTIILVRAYKLASKYVDIEIICIWALLTILTVIIYYMIKQRQNS